MVFNINIIFNKYVCNINHIRHFATSQALLGRKTREPYDKRFGLHVNDAGPDNPGGTVELQEKLSRGPNMPRKPGVYSIDGKFHFIKEMVPEFVVPDLKNFKLKPYVSYSVEDITQSEFTAKQLFDATYAKELIEKYKSKKIDYKTLEENIKQLKNY